MITTTYAAYVLLKSFVRSMASAISGAVLTKRPRFSSSLSRRSVMVVPTSFLKSEGCSVWAI